MELAVPLIVEGRHVATLVGGRVFQQKPSQRQFRRLSRRLHEWGLNGTLRQAERAYFEVPVVPKKQFQGAARLLDILASQLAESAPRLLLAKSPNDPEAVAAAKKFVLAHVAEPMTLKQAASHVNLSRNHFCRLFSHSTGITFLEFVARARVEKAKQLLEEGQLRITEVADRAGFQSISQFNRVFRRVAGASPTRFRAGAVRRRVPGRSAA
jgi:AraC-like DNA-binding protein